MPGLAGQPQLTRGQEEGNGAEYDRIKNLSNYSGKTVIFMPISGEYGQQ
jgi:hypothetical protein